MIAICDTGPLFAAADGDDAQHSASLRVLRDGALQLVIPALVVAELTYFIASRLGAAAEARFLAALGAMEVEPPFGSDWARMAELVQQYADLRLGGTDASIVALAERLNVTTIVTLDRRHFAAVRPLHAETFTLLP